LENIRVDKFLYILTHPVHPTSVGFGLDLNGVGNERWELVLESEWKNTLVTTDIYGDESGLVFHAPLRHVKNSPTHCVIMRLFEYTPPTKPNG